MPVLMYQATAAAADGLIHTQVLSGKHLVDSLFSFQCARRDSIERDSDRT